MRRINVFLSIVGIIAAASIIFGNASAAAVSAALMAYYALVHTGARGGIMVKKSVPKVAVEDEGVRVSLTVESNFNGHVEIREVSSSFRGRTVKSRLVAGTSVEIFQSIYPLRRGVLNSVSEVVLTDETGLVERRVTLTNSITVFPSPRSIAAGMRGKRVAMLSEVSRLLGIGIETLEFEELREFMPGDEVRKIDWKATSKLQKLIVRVFKRESFPEVYILVNTDRRFRREFIGGGREGKIDYIVLIISQLVKFFSSEGGKVSVISYDESSVRSIIMKDDPNAVVEALRIEQVEGIPPVAPMEFSVASEPSGLVDAVRKVQGGSYVVVVDDIALHPVDFVRADKMLSKRGSMMVFIYPNPILFMNIEPNVSEEFLVSLYRGYTNRKNLLRDLSRRVKILEVGPGDLLPKIVRRL